MFTLEQIDSEEAIKAASKNLDKLIELVNARQQYYDEKKEKLTDWLINGILILNSYGDIGFFESTEIKSFPAVIKYDHLVKGCASYGGSQYKLPTKGAICPACGNGFNIMSVYKQDFAWVNDVVCHSGECKKFQIMINSTLNLLKELMTIVKRVFGSFENVCIDDGTKDPYRPNTGNQIMKISFIVSGYEIKIFINLINEMPYCTIKFENENSIGTILSDSHYNTTEIELVLTSWKNARIKK